MDTFVQNLTVSSNCYVFVDDYGNVVHTKDEILCVGIRFCNIFFCLKNWVGGPPLTTTLDMRWPHFS